MEKEYQKLVNLALHSYAPHGVNFKCVDEDSGEFEILPLVRLNYEQDYATIGNHEFDFDELPLLWLNPIECLTKPITVEGYNDGKDFIPIEEMCKEFYFHKSKTDYKITKTHVYTSCESRNGESVYVMKDYNKIDYWIIEYLNQWHIDWRGLIPKGLAVAITKM